MAIARRPPRAMSLLFILLALLSIGDCYYRPYDGFEPDPRYMGSPWPVPSIPRSDAFRRSEERRMTIRAENATISLYIHQTAPSAKEATDLARGRYEHIKHLYFSICGADLESNVTAYEERSLAIENQQWGQRLETDDSAVIEGRPVGTHIDVLVMFADISALHRFVYRISTTGATGYAVMPSMTWGVSTDTQTRVNEKLEVQANEGMRYWSSREHTDRYGVDTISKEECRTSYRIEGRYLSTNDGRRFDFGHWHGVYDYFGENPDVSPAPKAGEVTTWLTVTCSFRAVKHGTAELMRQAAESMLDDL